MLAKRKYNRGRDTRPLWIFGMIDTVTKIFIIQYVEKRDKETLLPIIKKNCLPNTEIWSDQWRAYRTLPDIEGYNFIHRTVNHT